MYRFEVYSSAGEWRWRLRAINNKIIADSAEGYARPEDAERGIELVREAAAIPDNVRRVSSPDDPR